MTEKQDWDEEEDEPGINVLALLQALAKRKLLIIAVCGIAALISAIYALRLPNIYAATAQVLPPQKDGGAVSSVLGQLGGIAGIAAGAAKGSENELYLSLLKSRSVAAGVIQRLDLGRKYGTATFNQTCRVLEGAVKASCGKDGIIVVTAEDRDPKFAAILANTMVDELGRTMVRLNLSKVGAERIFLEKRLEVVKRDLQVAENDLKDFSQRNRIAQVEGQAAASINTVTKLKTELGSKEVQLAALRTSQSDDSYEVKELQAVIRRLKQDVAGLSGASGGGEGIPSLGKVPSIGLEYARKLRELKTQEALYEQLTKQYEMAKLNQAKDSSSLQVLDEAYPPEHKVRPLRAKLVATATLVAFVGSALLVFLLEYLETLPQEDREALRTLKEQALSFK